MKYIGTYLVGLALCAFGGYLIGQYMEPLPALATCGVLVCGVLILGWREWRIFDDKFTELTRNYRHP